MASRKELQDAPIRPSRDSSGRPGLCLVLALPLLAPFLTPGQGADRSLAPEEARFDIYVAGREVGQEKFSIQGSADSVLSNSVVSFRDPGNQHQQVRMETQLNMDRRYQPRTYLLHTDIGGQKAAMAGTFVPGEASFEFRGGGNPRKSGLLVGDHYTILDTNVFHHFIFIARLFDFGSAKSQSMEVVIPQELDVGVLKVEEAGIEKTTVRGRKRELHHLRVDSGHLLIDLWVDDQRILYKIVLPAKGIEVIRSP